MKRRTWASRWDRNRRSTSGAPVTDRTLPLPWTFFTVQQGSDPMLAFATVVAEARRRQQHERRSAGGNLADKANFVVLGDEPLWPEQAHAVARRLLDTADGPVGDPHGPAGALPVWTPLSPVTFPCRAERVTVTVCGDHGSYEYDAVRRAATDQLIAERRLGGDNEQVTDLHAFGLPGGADMPPPQRRHRTDVRCTPATVTPVTRYVISGSTQHGLRVISLQHSSWETGFDRLEDACRFLAEQLNRQVAEKVFDQGTVTWEIDAVTRQPDGAPLATVTRELLHSIWTVDVTVTEFPSVRHLVGNVPPNAWLFFGRAVTNTTPANTTPANTAQVQDRDGYSP